MNVNKNFVAQTVKWILSLLKNKIIASLVLFVQGLMFIIMPNGDMTGTVKIAAAVLSIAAVVNIFVHLLSKERNILDFIFIFFSVILGAVGFFFFFRPEIAEPYTRYIIAIVTVIMNFINMIEVIKIEKKFNWKMVLGVFISIVMIGLGVTMIVANEGVIKSMQRGIGGLLILNALTDLWYIIRMALIMLHKQDNHRKRKELD